MPALHAARHRALPRWSALTSMVAGSILVTTNQGPALFAGHFQRGQIGQVALNDALPFCLATRGGLINNRRR